VCLRLFLSFLDNGKKLTRRTLAISLNIFPTRDIKASKSSPRLKVKLPLLMETYLLLLPHQDFAIGVAETLLDFVT